jgi:hypothetical protein
MKFAVMKKLLFSFFLVINFWTTVLCHAQAISFTDTAAAYFEELKVITGQHISLWNYDLYAPVLLVDPVTRFVFANTPDSAGILKTSGKIYTGLLPTLVNISNTSIQWSGINWAMVMLPLSQNKNNRINLLTHELFHRAQKALGFFPYNPDNNHLDKKDGRIYLRLELEALQKALFAVSDHEVKKHIGQALAFRLNRHSLFLGSDSTENLLELNEGICEFTGNMMSGRSDNVAKDYFFKSIQQFIASHSYIRSFAYQTTPVYGYLLSAFNKNWNKEISIKTDLFRYFTEAFAVKFPADIANHVNKISGEYNGQAICLEEAAREEKIAKQKAAYKTLLIDSPHTELPLVNMNMSFDYTKMVTLENFGTVYPVIRITDNWGILDVDQAALINPGWNRVSIGYPLVIEGNKISGEGWTLELKEGYMLVKDDETRNYDIKRK